MTEPREQPPPLVLALGTGALMAMVGWISFLVARHLAPPPHWWFWRVAAPLLGIATPSLIGVFWNGVSAIWNFNPLATRLNGLRVEAEFHHHIARALDRKTTVR